MFTVKFYKSYESGEESSISFSCPMYEVHRRESGNVTISIYKTHTVLESGVDIQMTNKGDASHSYYHSCYIENEAGKTIEAIKPTD